MSLPLSLSLVGACSKELAVLMSFPWQMADRGEGVVVGHGASHLVVVLAAAWTSACWGRQSHASRSCSPPVLSRARQYHGLLPAVAPVSGRRPRISASVPLGSPRRPGKHFPPDGTPGAAARPPLSLPVLWRASAAPIAQDDLSTAAGGSGRLRGPCPCEGPACSPMSCTLCVRRRGCPSPHQHSCEYGCDVFDVEWRCRRRGLVVARNK